MTRPIPIFATLIVALAVAAMIALGFWQLARLQQKEAALALYSANLTAPPTAYPVTHPTDEHYLFRTLWANCRRVTGWQIRGGRSREDVPGWRHIATCASGAEGSELLVDMGVGSDPNGKIGWAGGRVSGRATYEPDSHSFITRLIEHAPPLRLMIVADRAAPGLKPSPLPDPSSVPNNHFSYAMQWFFFAAVALVIYGLALRKRWRERP